MPAQPLPPDMSPAAAQVFEAMHALARHPDARNMFAKRALASRNLLNILRDWLRKTNPALQVQQYIVANRKKGSPQVSYSSDQYLQIEDWFFALNAKPCPSTGTPPPGHPSMLLSCAARKRYSNTKTRNLMINPATANITC